MTGKNDKPLGYIHIIVHAAKCQRTRLLTCSRLFDYTLRSSVRTAWCQTPFKRQTNERMDKETCRFVGCVCQSVHAMGEADRAMFH